MRIYLHLLTARLLGRCCRCWYRIRSWLPLGDCVAGNVYLSSGLREVEVSTVRPPAQVWLTLDTNNPVDTLAVRTTATGFVILANIQSEQAQLSWIATGYR